MVKQTQIVPETGVGPDAPAGGEKGQTWNVVRQSAASAAQDDAKDGSVKMRVQAPDQKPAAEKKGADDSAPKVVPWDYFAMIPRPGKKWVNALIESPPVTTTMMCATFWTLIADDIRIAAELDMVVDWPFEVVTSVCFFLFAIELLCSMYSKDGYIRTPYFFFDIVATATLVMEMSWLVASDDTGVSNTRAVDAARTARTVRLLRVVRLVRLVRIVKLYRYIMDYLTKDVEAENKKLNAASGPSWEDNPSAVGRALQESITLQVILGVLIMLIVFPYLSVQETRIRLDYEVETVLQLDGLYRGYLEAKGASAALQAIEAISANSQEFMGLAHLSFFDGTVFLDRVELQPPNVRNTEYRSILAGSGCESAGECSTGAFFIRPDNVIQAQFSLYLIAFVIVLLFMGVILFNRISMKYCIAPIEKLFTIVNTFAKDPMQKLESFEDDTLDELNELERSIRKVASLLQVGIGLAGRDTIARVMRTTGDINPIAMGHKVNCLFGFCDIRQFTDATECLQEQVMLFTNSVGYIVHHAVHDCGGFANKNIGDAFLVAWTGDKLESRIKQVEHAARNAQIGAVFTENDLEVGSRDRWTPTVGDESMAAFIRLTIVVRGSDKITEIVQHPVLQRRLPGYTVRLGCGLHVGWAIEGALGSQKKIDATYLSPATNISMALEGATKQYGNLLLISEETYKLFSPFVKKLVRRIDRVFAVQGAEPFDLYTYDCSTKLKVHPDEAETKALTEHVFDYPLGITPEFRAEFEKGLDLYIKGAWPQAKDQLEAANALLVKQAEAAEHLDAPDKPTMALIKYMKEFDFKPPADWTGSRELE